MEGFIDEIVTYIVQYIQSGGIHIGMFIVILESILPMLPLGVFVALNMMAFGYFIGFTISYIATIIGCLLSYFLIKYFFSNYISKKAKEKVKLQLIVNRLNKIKFTNLVLVLALPFTPAFLINISAGLVKYDIKKYFYALLISKLSIISFWGYIGMKAITNMRDMRVLLFLLILIIITYIISKIVSKKLEIE